MSGKAVAVWRRRWWVVLLSTCIAVVGALVVLSLRATPWTTTAVLLVPSQEATDGGFLGDPNDAARLAATYAAFLLRDDQLMRAAADRARVDREAMEEALSVQNIENTAVIEVSARAETAAAAATLLDAFVQAATRPDTDSIEPGSLTVIRIESPLEGFALPPLVSALIAALLGAGVGVALATLWERSDPRIDTRDDMVRFIDLPVTARSEFATLSASVVQRWAALGRGTGDAVLVGIGRSGDRIAKSIVEDPGPVGRADFKLHVAKSRSSELVDARFVVAVVPRGVRARDAWDEFDHLGALGSPARWIIFDS